MSAARSIAMERNILEIMKDREEIESATYSMVSDALSKLGLSAIIFDIKNIRDIDGSDAIASLERVKIAELKRDARISEATHNSSALKIEIEKEKENTIAREHMKQEEENARLERERITAERMLEVEAKKLAIAKQNAEKMAAIEREKQRIMAEAAREKQMILAKAEAEAVEIKAKAESNSIRMKSEAEAEGIKLRGIAEAEAIKKRAEAMKEYESAGEIGAKIKMIEILSKAQVEMAAKIAEGLGKNSKIMYLPMNDRQGFLSEFIPKIDAILQSDVIQGGLSDFIKKISL
ncbi:MAG: SPFH domain-containing protein, partial [Promethearchaeota archaeon]